MITPNTHAARGGLSNPETRAASRAEAGADFREEVSRERVRERTTQKKLAAEAVRTGAPDREMRARDDHDSSTLAEEPSTEVAAGARDDDARGDLAPVADDGRGTRGSAPSPTPGARAREEGAQGAATTPAGVGETQSAVPSALTAPTPALLSTAPGANQPAPSSLDASASTAPSPEGEGASGIASPRPMAFTAAPLADAMGLQVAAQAHDAAPLEGLEVPREARAGSAPEGGSNALALAVRGPASIADAAPAASTTPARLAPAEIPQFLKDLQVRVDGTAGSAFVELEPIALGRLTVELSLQPEGGVRADVRAERPDGFAAIEARLPELRAALLERGFASADVQISLGLGQRDARREGDDMQSRHARRDGSQTIDTQRVLALAPNRTGSIDLWA